MNRSRARHGDARREPNEFQKEVLAYLNNIQDGQKELALMIGGADRRAENRSKLEIGIEIMNATEMMTRFVALQTKMTDGVAANKSLIEKMTAEIRKAAEASANPIPPEVDAVIASFEANVDALAAATAAGTQAFPADLPIPPVVDAGGSTAGNTEPT